MFARSLILLCGLIFALTAATVSGEIGDRPEVIVLAEAQAVDVPTQTQTEAKTFCRMQKHSGYNMGGRTNYANGDGAVTYFDPAVECTSSTTYPFEITGGCFYLYDDPSNTYQWPVYVDFVVYALAVPGNPGAGPGQQLYRRNMRCDSVPFDYYSGGACFGLSARCCVDGPVFVGLEYNDPGPGPFPSIAFDDNFSPPSGEIWHDSGGVFYEHYSFLGSPPPFGYPIIWVDGNTNSTNCGQQQFLVYNTNDNGSGSLRQAINNANVSPGRDLIHFNIPGTGPHTIMPDSQLAPLSDPNGVIIDGITQAGGTCGGAPPRTCTLMVEISGINAGFSHGLIIVNDSNDIRGLVINDFERDGISIQGRHDTTEHNYIYCNFVGTDPLGIFPVGNGRAFTGLPSGIYVTALGSHSSGHAFFNVIDRNLSSGNFSEGISIAACPPNRVEHNSVLCNFVGTDITGMLPGLGNINAGVYIGEGACWNLVDGNLISGNGQLGVSIVGYAENGWFTDTNTVSNNTIGLDYNLAPLGNGRDGVGIGAYFFIIPPNPPYLGGHARENLITGNIISQNLLNGVMVYEDTLIPSAAPRWWWNADNNPISQNSIYCNGLLGIDLFDDFVTPNDPLDPDIGANQEVNYPVITNVTYAAGTSVTTVTGTLDVGGSEQLAAVEVFQADIDPSGFGEGRTYLGATNPTAGGNWTFNTTALSPGDTVTATATDQFNNTSEFCFNWLVPGQAVIDSCEYYKAQYTDYAPQGIPDFDQKQSSWSDAQGWTHCGPTAVANCMWWFDSKYEPSPVDPRPFGVTAPNDGYSLVSTYGSWDDHDTLNVQPLVNDLANLMGTDATCRGTNPVDLVNGTRQFIMNGGLSSYFRDSIEYSPTFDFIKQQVLDCQDVILLLGFYQDDGQGSQSIIGSHWVTVAGVCTMATRLCISDPYYDNLEGEPPAGSAHGGTVHNDADNISGPHGQIQHDVYNVTTGGMLPMAYLPGYPITPLDMIQFELMNGIPTPDPPIPGSYLGGPIYTYIEFAYVICPVRDTVKCEPQGGGNPTHPSTYWYDVTPGDTSGRCDFHVKVFDSLANNYSNWVDPVGWQHLLHKVGSNWWVSWWDPGCTNPIYSIFRFQFDNSDSAVWSDWRTTIDGTDNPFGQVIDSAENHNAETDGYGYRVHVPFYQSVVTAKISLDSVVGEIGTDTIPADQNLKFIMRWTYSDTNPIISFNNGFRIYSPDGATWQPIVLDTFNLDWATKFEIGFFTPYFSANGSGADTVYVSGVSLINGVVPPFDSLVWWIETKVYPQDTGKHLCIDSSGVYLPGWDWLWVTNTGSTIKPDWDGPHCFEIVSAPCDCVPGEANNDATTNIFDITYLISYLYMSGPAPVPYALCSGDPNCDCTVNIFDITYLISYLYMSGPAPCDCLTWLAACGPPLRK